MSAPDLSVVVPAYNEGDSIEPVLRKLAAAVDGVAWEGLVVVDFVEDTTIPVVERVGRDFPGVRIHLNRRGRGVLNAIRSGFDAATAPFVLVTMGDGSDDPNDVLPMLKRAQAGADVVAASRYMPGGRQHGGPLLKRTLSRMAGVSLHWVGGLPIHDPTSNFKLYSRRLLDSVEIESQAGFELALELSVKAHLAGLRLDEVPTIWQDRTSGESRFRLLEWLPHYIRWYWAGISRRPVTH